MASSTPEEDLTHQARAHAEALYDQWERERNLRHETSGVVQQVHGTGPVKQAEKPAENEASVSGDASIDAEIKAAVQRCLQPEVLRAAILEAVKKSSESVSDTAGREPMILEPHAWNAPIQPGLFSRSAYEVGSATSTQRSRLRTSIGARVRTRPSGKDWISAGSSRAAAEASRRRRDVSPGRTKVIHRRQHGS